MTSKVTVYQQEVRRKENLCRHFENIKPNILVRTGRPSKKHRLKYT